MHVFYLKGVEIVIQDMLKLIDNDIVKMSDASGRLLLTHSPPHSLVSSPPYPLPFFSRLLHFARALLPARAFVLRRRRARPPPL
jgi:hypothetical protein